MKKYTNLLMLFFFASTMQVFAQDGTIETTVENTDDFVEFKKDINKAKDRLVMDFSYDMLLNLPDSIKTKGFSRGFNIYFTYDIVLGKSRFSVAPGIGIGNNNYFMKYAVSSDSLGTYFNKIDSDVAVKKSKIALSYIDIPLELRFRSAPNKKGSSWKLAAGFKAGLMIQNKWKYKGEAITNRGESIANNSENVKFKNFDIENVNKFRYGVMVRGGYGIVNLFAYYSLSDVFNDKGPRMTPLSFGITINGL
ncbi:MAG TPA: porin family protein [Chitinophagales bacterium]|nr:porin family protein [Chitinophagales bacterium]